MYVDCYGLMMKYLMRMLQMGSSNNSVFFFTFPIPQLPEFWAPSQATFLSVRLASRCMRLV